MTAQGGITVDKPPSSCNSAAAAGLLEDDERHSHAGYQFTGTAGETVVITLDRDGAAGSTGETAQLSLGSQQGATLAQQQGAVPVEITATLPASGSYVVQATETPGAAAGSGGPFRGYYLLTVTATSGDEIELEPLPSTQP